MLWNVWMDVIINVQLALWNQICVIPVQTLIEILTIHVTVYLNFIIPEQILYVNHVTLPVLIVPLIPHVLLVLLDTIYLQLVV